MLSRKRRAAFTLLEAIVALAIIALISSLGFAGMTKCNQDAVAARLYTLAQEIARDQIDQVESAAPFNPQFTTPQIPTVLAIGTTTASKPLYIDPTTGSTTVSATLTTTIADTGSYSARAATVTVTYSYRNRAYTVAMNTIRATDS